MGQALQLEIKEDLNELKQLYNQEHDGRRKERLHMLYLYKSGQATTRQGLLKTLGRSGPTVTSWLNKYRQGGLEA